MKNRLILTGLLAATLVSLSGCGLLVVGGAAAGTAAVATDRRTAGEQVEDRTIVMKAGAETRRLLENKEGRINTSSYAGVALLTGDVPTEADKAEAGRLVSQVEKVTRVVNELRVGEPTPLSTRSNDSWISTRVNTALINTKEVPSRTISVTTERGVVYLQGRVTQAEGERAAIAAASIPGVTKVAKLFEYVSAESLAQPLSSNAQTAAPAPAAPAAAPAASSVEVMPVQ
ncbi:BON domain-containing protein [Alcaligenes sp. SDU_A2]|uniref:BON domain-containing protein n=1 Tax=Alcaligenes sp. SDU_A2 TaxID=3136634 RepID=UPI00311FE4C4